MKRFEDNCVGPCPQGCMGRSCPKRHELVFSCDSCGEEVDRLYEYDGKDYCSECLLDTVPYQDADSYEGGS